MVSSLIESRPIGYLGVIRTSRNFRFLWFGQIISDLGDWFNLIASASLIGKVTESGLAVSALFFVRTLAPFLVSPFGGVIADRYNRRNVIILMNLIRAPLMFGFLLIRDTNVVWLLYLLTAIVGVTLDTSLGISGTAWWMAGLTLCPNLLWGIWVLTAGKAIPIFLYQGANLR